MTNYCFFFVLVVFVKGDNSDTEPAKNVIIAGDNKLQLSLVGCLCALLHRG